MGKMRVCQWCKIEKHISRYRVHSAYGTVEKVCKTCRNAAEQRRRRKTPRPPENCLPWSFVIEHYNLNADEQHTVEIAAHQWIKHDQVTRHNRNHKSYRPRPVVSPDDIISKSEPDTWRQVDLLRACVHRAKELQSSLDHKAP